MMQSTQLVSKAHAERHARGLDGGVARAHRTPPTMAYLGCDSHVLAHVAIEGDDRVVQEVGAAGDVDHLWGAPAMGGKQRVASREAGMDEVQGWTRCRGGGCRCL